jgi:long-chain acyl-CoA synthetase
MNLTENFGARATAAPDHPAICWGDEIWSYARLAAKSRAAAQTLRTCAGVRPGDRVAIWLQNCPEFVAALLGVLDQGAVAVPMNNFLKPAEANHILRDSGADTLISDGSMSERFPALLAEHPHLRILDVQEITSGGTGVPVTLGTVPTSEDDLAVIIYTSGTTGRPKGAMLSHGNLRHNVESCRQMLAIRTEDRVVVLLPMFHSFMLCVGICLPLLTGCSIVLIRSLHPPKAVIEEMIRHRGTILPAIPQFFRTMAGLPAGLEPPLRLCISGAAPLPGQVLEEFQRRFRFPLLEGYGLSEASPVVSMNPVAGPWKAGSIGVPIPGVEVSVQDERGCLLGTGEIGEICVRGENVMKGYWNQPEETAHALRNRWLLTGDVGYRDAEGYFFITDRKKDMLLVNGNNVYPREIEEVVYRFPGVKEAAVVGMPDARRGEQAVAFISTADHVRVDEQALLKFARERLADYKVPRKVVQLDALPRNATGKILKTDLRRMLTRRPS